MSQSPVSQSTDPVRAARAIMLVYREFEQATRSSVMNMGQYRTLLFLRSGPKRASEIAEAAVLKKPTVTGRLNGLRELAWIEDKADPRDGRALRIAITERGLQEMHAFELLLTDRLQTLFPGADMAVLAQLYELLAPTREARMDSVEEQWLR